MVKFEYAFDSQGKIHYINNLYKGHNLGPFTCITCGEPMKARPGKGVDKGGNTPHFAHKSSSYNHADESELHYNTKAYLSLKLNEILDSNDKNEFIINVFCNDCNSTKRASLLYGLDDESMKSLKLGNYSNNLHEQPTTHNFEYNLLQDVTSVKPEKKVDNFVPDVSLYHGEALIKAIEVVYTHEDEDVKVQYYRNEKIDVVRVYVKTDDDLRDLENGILDMIEVELNRTVCQFKSPISKDEMSINLYFRSMQYYRYIREIFEPFFSKMDDYINRALISNRKVNLKKIFSDESKSNSKTTSDSELHEIRKPDNKIKNDSELYEMIRKYRKARRTAALTSYDVQEFMDENPHSDIDPKNVDRLIKMGNACGWGYFVKAIEHYHKYKPYNKY
ncbi:hypothetical protein MettiDRAFT_2364 [Methanolobus tindarius DSM 2278]|uniref:Competence protein n=1 Tax=Methanolobus tindarius DSM 2278 TaxID=1090322 RepID=W9DYT1_METTI|nr:hypothetical protein [Methanolobus tindarius]ETA68877.1 hypothetical protein MettiDRAFT_2364 [Methanolobus tindarius DSM 2278]